MRGGFGFGMVYSVNNLKNTQADMLLGESRIRQDTFLCDLVYKEDVGFTELYSHRNIEISMVVQGSGIARILGQVIPCKAGDIYILNSNVPYGYFVAESGESITVRRIIFDPRDWLDGEIAQTASPKFCHGVFSENPLIAYAMLTQQMLNKIMSWCDALTIETLEKRVSGEIQSKHTFL